MWDVLLFGQGRKWKKCKDNVETKKIFWNGWRVSSEVNRIVKKQNVIYEGMFQCGGSKDSLWREKRWQSYGKLCWDKLDLATFPFLFLIGCF